MVGRYSTGDECFCVVDVVDLRSNNASYRATERTQGSAADAFSEGTPSFPTPASSLRSLSPPKKRTASTKADLAYLNPHIEFLLLRNAEEIGILLPESVTELWRRCEVRSVLHVSIRPAVLY